eukprot:9152047-Lingulodinium_polyedra.AAC.1
MVEAGGGAGRRCNWALQARAGLPGRLHGGAPLEEVLTPRLAQAAERAGFIRVVREGSTTVSGHPR